MDSNRVQQALISLEDRFRELRDLGQKRLQVQETTISDLRNELSGAIAAEMEAAKQLQELRNKYNQSVEDLHNEYEHKIKDLSDQLTRKSTEVETLRVRCEIFAQRARQAELLKQRLEDLQGALKEKTREEEQMLEIISSLSERSKSLKSEIQAETQKRSQAHSVLAGSFTLLRRYASLNSRLMQALSGSK